MKENIHATCGNNNMKNRILIIFGIIILAIILSMIIPTGKEKKWTYNLPNHYVVGKVSKDSIIIGKYINNKLVTKDNDKTIGISEYVEAFAVSDKYIYARTITSDNYLTVNYYLIDSSNEKIYGSYELEGFLDKLKQLELSTEIEWVETANLNK